MFIITREADVGHMRGVTEITLVFGLEKEQNQFGPVWTLSYGRTESENLSGLEVLEEFLTHIFFSAGEVEELDEAEVVSSHQAEASVGNTGAVHIGLIGISRPNAQNFVPEDAGK